MRRARTYTGVTNDRNISNEYAGLDALM